MKKQSAGFYTNALAAVLAVVGVIAYSVNCGTDYFVSKGNNPAIMVCGIAAAIVLAGVIVLTQKGPNIIGDLLAIAAPVLLMAATVLLAGLRVGDIASIMTFENNASTMADMTSAVVALVALLVGNVISIVAAFQDVTK